MPIKPVSGMKALPLATPDDVARLVDLLAQPGSDARGLGDHFAYLAGVRSDWFRQYQGVVIDGLLDRLEVGFADECLLLANAPDHCVEVLARRLRQTRSFTDAWALAAIGTEAALTAVAEDMRTAGDRQDYQDSGVWVPASTSQSAASSEDRRALNSCWSRTPDRCAAC